MASRTASKKAKRGASRPAKGDTSTASRGLVLRVIRNDPECEWIGGFVQQFGERSFGVERFEQLNDQQRVGWIRFNNAMARIGRSVAQGEGDHRGVLRFLERVGEEEESTELAQVEAEVEAVAKTPGAAGGENSPEDGEKERAAALLEEEIEDRRHKRALRKATHAQKMRDWEARRKIQVAWDAVVIGVTVFCVLVSTILIVFGVVSDEPRLIGGSGITAGIAMIGLLKMVLWSKWNPPPPRQFR